ncbi:MAG: hypothetical protein RLZZ245_3478 [Verrucomicrobiota bacterium]
MRRGWQTRERVWRCQPGNLKNFGVNLRIEETVYAGEVTVVDLGDSGRLLERLSSRFGPWFGLVSAGSGGGYGECEMGLSEYALGKHEPW